MGVVVGVVVVAVRVELVTAVGDVLGDGVGCEDAGVGSCDLVEELHAGSARGVVQFALQLTTDGLELGAEVRVGGVGPEVGEDGELSVGVA